MVTLPPPHFRSLIFLNAFLSGKKALRVSRNTRNVFYVFFLQIFDSFNSYTNHVKRLNGFLFDLTKVCLEYYTKIIYLTRFFLHVCENKFRKVNPIDVLGVISYFLLSNDTKVISLGCKPETELRVILKLCACGR